MKIRKPFTASLVVLLLSGCSGSTEDVQLTLCKQLAGDLVFGDFQHSDWSAAELKPGGYDDLEVIVRYRTGSGQGETRCYYAYNTPAGDENAMTQVNPTTAYSTYPSKVTQDGKELDSMIWANKINGILLKQGKEAIKMPVEKISEEIKTLKL